MTARSKMITATKLATGRLVVDTPTAGEMRRLTLHPDPDDRYVSVRTADVAPDVEVGSVVGFKFVGDPYLRAGVACPCGLTHVNGDGYDKLALTLDEADPGRTAKVIVAEHVGLLATPERIVAVAAEEVAG